MSEEGLVYFIEREVSVDGYSEEAGSGRWARYTSSFCSVERAVGYFQALCPRTYRIRAYAPTEKILTPEEIKDYDRRRVHRT